MKQTTSLLAVVALVATLFVGAPVAAQVDTGSADFSRYVSMGDSLTAAIVSGGWLDTFQINSYPALIHRQATGGDAGFEQPLLGAPGITPPMFLANLVPPIFGALPGLGVPTNLNLPRPYNNLGIPGADAGDLLRTVTDGMGPFDLVLRGQGTALQQALALQPTFITIWIGSNDALGAATSGTVIDGVTLTTAASFEADYRAIVSSLAATGAGLMIANLPEVTAIPFVTTLAPVVINPATNQPVTDPAGNLIPLLGPNGPLALNDHVLLTAGGLLAQGFGIPTFLGGNGQPLPGQVILDAAETATITNRIAAFNSIIQTVANEVGAAFYDLNRSFRQLGAEGTVVGGIDYGFDFLTGGLFSYDGVHASPFGYAFVANEMIEVINDSFGAEIPRVGLGPYVFGPNQLDPRGALGQAVRAVSQVKIKGEVWDNLRFLGMNIPAIQTTSTTTPGGGGGDVGEQGNGNDTAEDGDQSDGGDQPQGNANDDDDTPDIEDELPEDRWEIDPIFE
ncbi:MAG: hypothetical protein K0U98_26310 [Deltaproteobacteria bacterium]|nr:hypothetical protein [Deltaproteobacteria bacterium]